MIDDLHFTRPDPSWPARFEGLRHDLQERLPRGVVVEHVGSTAVPGLSAKDCIDMLILVTPPDRAAAAVALRDLGYELRPDSFADDPDRWFWRLIVGDRRHAHVHLMLSGHPAAREMLAVRDLLRTDPAWREAYQQLKSSLAAGNAHDRPAYLQGKVDFIHRMTAAAVADAQAPDVTRTFTSPDTTPMTDAEIDRAIHDS